MTPGDADRLREARQHLAHGTARRFLMLLSVLLVACVYMLYTAALMLRPESFLDCPRPVREEIHLSRLRFIEVDTPYAACRDGVADEAARFTVAGTALVLVAAVLLYWFLPGWRNRRGRLIPASRLAVPKVTVEADEPPPWGKLPHPAMDWPLQEVDAEGRPTGRLVRRAPLGDGEPTQPHEPGRLPGWPYGSGREPSEPEQPTLRVRVSDHTEPLTEHLTGLAQWVGLSRLPRFVVDPRALTAGAVAFGRAGRYTISLNAGLIPRRVSDPWLFEAVVLHELAHVRNRDVDLAYLAEALWRVVAVAVLLPYLAVLAWLTARTHLAGMDLTTWAEATLSVGKLAFGVFLVAQVYLARAEVLRRRELCADFDAVWLGADPEAWSDQRLARTDRRREAWPRKLARWLGGFGRPHPTWDQRQRLLTGSTHVPGVTGSQALLAYSALFGVLFAVSQGIPGWLTTAVVYLAGPVVVAGLIGSTPAKRPPFLVANPGAAWETSGGDDAWARQTAEQYRNWRRRVRWRIVAGTAAGVALVTALFSFDPLGGVGMLDNSLTPPPAYIAAPPAPAPLPSDAKMRQVLDWFDNGGDDAVARLGRRVDEGPAYRGGDPLRSLSQALHCLWIRDAIADGRALPPPPAGSAEYTWQLLLSSAEQGSDLLCQPDLDGEDLPRQARRHYTTARLARDLLEAMKARYAAAL